MRDEARLAEGAGWNTFDTSSQAINIMNWFVIIKYRLCSGTGN